MFEGPCTACEHKTGCAPYAELRGELFGRPGFQVGDPLDAYDVRLDAIGGAWLRSAAQSRLDQRDRAVSIAALFDFLCSGLYARDALSLDGGPRHPRALRCGQELIFPYTWMCPRCVARALPRETCYLPNARREAQGDVIRDFPEIEYLAKPRSRFIGDVGLRVLKSVIRVMLATDPSAGVRLSEGGGRRGEFDLTIATDAILVLAEVKAKPLVAFPLVIEDPSAATGQQHAWETAFDARRMEAKMFVASAGILLPLGLPGSTPLWPLEAMGTASAAPSTVEAIARGWRRQLDAYRKWKDEPDVLRWHRFGCGNFGAMENGERIEKRVANTKELPGLDRTDDIKKGSSQVLLLSRFKRGCRKRAIAGALLGNVYAETHGEDYLDHLVDMEVRVQGETDFVWLFDMILGLTRNVFHHATLGALFDTERVLERAGRIAGP